MAERAEVSADVVAKLRAVCLELPEAFEEDAWVGTRWKVRTKTFAHVLRIDDGWPPAYAAAAGSDGPLVVLTFRAAGPELDALAKAGTPFFKPVWFPDIVGMVLGARVDWGEVQELLVESYCTVAPKKLVQLLDRSSG